MTTGVWPWALRLLGQGGDVHSSSRKRRGWRGSREEKACAGVQSLPSGGGPSRAAGLSRSRPVGPSGRAVPWRLLAVSGQNVAALPLRSLAAAALGALCVETQSAGSSPLILVLITVYVPVTESRPVDCRRARAMSGAGVVAALGGRPRSRWYAILLAAGRDARAGARAPCAATVRSGGWASQQSSESRSSPRRLPPCSPARAGARAPGASCGQQRDVGDRGEQRPPLSRLERACSGNRERRNQLARATFPHADAVRPFANPSIPVACTS